ncbi:hypothetical protein TNCV_1631801 [Trichonephila clavipes]|nr:hypothetical protein TNCV_1631801 [Trichonephila clavipes]
MKRSVAKNPRVAEECDAYFPSLRNAVGANTKKLIVLPPTAVCWSDVVQSGRPIFDDFFQHLWPYIGNNTANVVFQMVKRWGLSRIDQ